MVYPEKQLFLLGRNSGHLCILAIMKQIGILNTINCANCVQDPDESMEMLERIKTRELTEHDIEEKIGENP